MIKVGLTGNIGAGKSFVCKEFNRLYNIPVFNSDKELAYMYQHSSFLKDKINNVFPEIIDETGISKILIGEHIIPYPDKIKKLTNITKDALIDKFNHDATLAKCRHIWTKNKFRPAYMLFESAIIFDTKSEDNFDFIIWIDANTDMRMTRILERDGEITTYKVQQSYEENKNKIDFIIHNNEPNELTTQLEHLHNLLTKINKYKYPV